MYVSHVDLKPGMPSAPTVRIRDVGGPMPAGRYWFALLGYYTKPESGEQSYTDVSENGVMTVNTSGMEAMGPARKIHVDHPWTTVELGEIPIDQNTPFMRVMMSLDGKTFWQIGTAPAVNQTFSTYTREDTTDTWGDWQNDGRYRIVIQNPAARYQTTTGTVVNRDKDSVARPTHDMSFQPHFTAQGRPQYAPPFQPYTSSPTVSRPAMRTPDDDDENIGCSACAPATPNMATIAKTEERQMMGKVWPVIIGLGVATGTIGVMLLMQQKSHD